jgi:4-amino-4-deoxy-L-arabinose transferase-like glycosyltransferase
MKKIQLWLLSENNSIIRHWEKYLGIFCFGLLTFLGLYNQPYFPFVYTDEGFVLQGAINLVKYGEYAMRSSEGFRVLDQPLIANGPGIVLLIAGVFHFFGIGLMQARITVTTIMLITSIIFFFLAKRLFGSPAAFLSTFILFAFPQEGFIWFGRMILGNVPALGCILAGFYLWVISLDHGNWRYSIGSGILFGLAMITKAQTAIIIPTFLLVGLIDYYYYKQFEIKRYLMILGIPILFFIIWNIAQFVIVGTENYRQHLAAIRSSTQVTIFMFRPDRIIRNIWYLIRSGASIFILPGIIYSGWACQYRRLESLQRLPLVLFVIFWLLWYMFFSIGWHRYTFDAFAVGSLFSGVFIIDIYQFIKKKSSNRSKLPEIYIRIGATVLLVAVLISSGWLFITQFKNIIAPPDVSLQRFAAYIEENIGQEALIESWEWEIDPLTTLNFHHPTNDWVDKMTLYLTFGEKVDPVYDFSKYGPDYLIDGPFSKSTDFYTSQLKKGCCELIISIEPFDLYRVQ